MRVARHSIAAVARIVQGARYNLRQTGPDLLGRDDYWQSRVNAGGACLAALKSKNCKNGEAAGKAQLTWPQRQPRAPGTVEVDLRAAVVTPSLCQCKRSEHDTGGCCIRGFCSAAVSV